VSPFPFVWRHRKRRDGIAIYLTDPRLPAPRLPLLGLRAIDENGLRRTINGSGRTVSMSTTGAA
jgi:hypothetical protein